ncbi:MAG: hypothetical protein WAL90_12365 [Desulfobacterales bacterium]
MLYAARFVNVLKNFIKRFRPGKAHRLVRTLAEEARADKALAPAGMPERLGSRAAAPDDVQAKWSVDGYPSAYRHPVSRGPSPLPSPDNGFDIDLVGIGDLETCAENLTVPAETIERWVGAGILSPRETDIAERLLRLLRANDLKRRTARPRFDA